MAKKSHTNGSSTDTTTSVLAPLPASPSVTAGRGGLFQATPHIQHDIPEDFDVSDVSLAELQQLERSIVQHPGARFTTTQRVFFECLLTEPDMDTKKAAKKAGVSLAQATRWLANPDTRAALNHLITRRYEAAGISPTEVTRQTHRAFRMAMGDSPLIRTTADEKGDLYVTEEHHTDLAAAARLLDLLSKQLGIYREDSKEAPPISINFDLSNGLAAGD